MARRIISSADAQHSRRPRRRTPGPGPFDPTSQVDTLDPAPWVPAEPPPPPRPPPRPRPTVPRRPSPAPPRRSRFRSLAVIALFAAVATGLVSLVTGVPVSPLGSDDAGRFRSAGAVPGPEELASSQAIVSGPGPVHPIRVEGPIDYGDGGAKFGADRWGHAHEGQDMFAKPGTPLLAVRDGVVIEKGNDGGRGNYVAIYSESADQTYVYLHMLRPTGLKPGADVAASTQVGAMGCTGSCYGTHLHFEVRSGKGIERKPIDPLPLLKRWPQVPE